MAKPRPFIAAKPAVSLFAASVIVAPPSERVVAAVLQFGDVREEHDDGLVTLRFTAARLERDDMALVLGEECGRARDVSIVWDEAQCEMVRVIDLAPLRAGRESVEQAGLYAAARRRTLRPAYASHRAAA
jgi:hypothetical protein